MERRLIEGVSVILDDREYIVPPLNLRVLKKYDKVLQQMKDNPADDWLDQMVEILTAALRRNYPEIDENFVWDNVDTRNLYQLLPALRGGSGEASAAASRATTAAEPTAGPSELTALQDELAKNGRPIGMTSTGR